jgi:hypothetical protein
MLENLSCGDLFLPEVAGQRAWKTGLTWIPTEHFDMRHTVALDLQFWASLAYSTAYPRRRKGGGSKDIHSQVPLRLCSM